MNEKALHKKSFFDQLEDELNGKKLPEYVKKILTNHAFDNAFVFRELNDDIFEEIENDETEKNKKEFKILLSDKILLKELAKIVRKRGLHYYKS